MTRMRTMFVLPALGLLALTAACGGGDNQTQEPATDAPAAAPAAEAPAAPPAAPATGADVKLHMVTTQGGANGAFEPLALTAKKGDVIVLTSDGVAMHNLSFNTPENAGKAGLPAATAYLTAGQEVRVPITMDPGTYTFQCDPHAALGMKGTLTVQ